MSGFDSLIAKPALPASVVQDSTRLDHSQDFSRLTSKFNPAALSHIPNIAAIGFAAAVPTFADVQPGQFDSLLSSVMSLKGDATLQYLREHLAWAGANMTMASHFSSSIAASSNALPSSSLANAALLPTKVLQAYLDMLHEVKPNETLSSIAQQTLGDANRWPEIYRLNKDRIGSDPDKIAPGMILEIPDDLKLANLVTTMGKVFSQAGSISNSLK